jgi:hypothetical protein
MQNRLDRRPQTRNKIIDVSLASTGILHIHERYVSVNIANTKIRDSDKICIILIICLVFFTL